MSQLIVKNLLKYLITRHIYVKYQNYSTYRLKVINKIIVSQKNAKLQGQWVKKQSYIVIRSHISRDRPYS